MDGTIGVLCLLIVLSAYFSATETAFSSLNRIRVKNMASEGNKKAKLALKLCDVFRAFYKYIALRFKTDNIFVFTFEKGHKGDFSLEE